MTVCPPLLRTKSVTLPGAAIDIEFPPVDSSLD